MAVALVALVLAGTLLACSAGREQAADLDGPLIGSTTTAAVDTTVAPTTTEAPTTTAPTTTMPTTTVPVPPPPPPPAPPVPPVVDGSAPLIYRVNTADPVVFVTIDDGYTADPTSLQYIIDTGMPVSMFLNEAPVRLHAPYFKALMDLGNQVHTHTLNHKNLTKLDLAGQQHEICGMVNVLRDTFGQVGHLMRAPYGSSNAITQQVAAWCGLRAVVHWTGELKDGTLFLQGATLKPGDIILTHFKDDLHANLVTLKTAADAAGLTIARLEDYTG